MPGRHFEKSIERLNPPGPPFAKGGVQQIPFIREEFKNNLFKGEKKRSLFIG
jgi:hypothetical protein